MHRGRSVHSKAKRRMPPSPVRGNAGRPPKRSLSKGKLVKPAVVQAQAATAAAAWGATATRWRDQLSTTAGEIITFAARRVLLLVILYTIEHVHQGAAGGQDHGPGGARELRGGGRPPAADLTGIYARFPTGPSSDELAAGTTAWLKANKPGVLDSKVEKAFREREWLIVWTPPYCPKFQPIELVWGAGKERASGM